jgi:hypothetical protein
MNHISHHTEPIMRRLKKYRITEQEKRVILAVYRSCAAIGSTHGLVSLIADELKVCREAVSQVVNRQSALVECANGSHETSERA